MESYDISMLAQHERSNWVRLRTLLTLRWAAVGGQVVAILVAVQLYGLTLPLTPVISTICVAAIANIATHAYFPQNKRLSEREASAMLAFDILQLGLLLYLTGGLNNPFALLILAPVTIAATVLHLLSFLALGALAIGMITLISFTSLPLQLADGSLLILPPLFGFGYWVSLVIGVMFLGIYARRVTTEMHSMGDALLATQLALEREQKLTDLGGVVAAAAHELGTPLATIKLVSTELVAELGGNPDLRDDVMLIRSQADRCGEILQSMGRAGKDDLMMKTAPLEAVAREAAEPHLDRKARVLFDIKGGSVPQPTIQRKPEIIHGLRNLIQNAVDFAQEAVFVRIDWSATEARVMISDDGHGFPQSVIGRIGDPYVRRRRSEIDGEKRPAYSGMGLGLFIAKTLLERSGASLTFANKSESGAVVTVTWPMRALVDISPAHRPTLGKNPAFLP
ncbi:ActS/PrrB/RegB family redox-sensitive histidine kinase [Loktanella sp. TSTF-M6]|uniref:histidine kinase n=1 Tax=Loktanella gaetbuli TaxID=2881335 RepID=A0ABS8BTY8_9RHOB|nr:ActS/PrrB/RegB family redox-sensitive histidine kinase [Loktanella gaetbuli]MCB5199187.1 ActS/PrrB/RegB family redox-sensitive histidine kinase [Loktanella gaetbuli]